MRHSSVDVLAMVHVTAPSVGPGFLPWILASDAIRANSRCFLYMQVCDFVISFPASLLTTVFPFWQRGRSGQGKRKAWPKNSLKPQPV